MKSQNQDLNDPQGTWFDEQTGYLMVRLEKECFGFVDKELAFREESYQPKKELHITILSEGAAEHVLGTMDWMPDRIARIRELVRETDWSYRKFQRFYHVRDEQGNQSIIQLVEVPGLGRFFEDLNRITHGQLEQPPTHVTLYVHGDPDGIGLPDSQTFDARVTGEVSPKVLQQEISRAAMDV